MAESFEEHQKSADYILGRIKLRPHTALVLGSGLGSFVRELERPEIIDYANIPGFLTASAPGHEGRLYAGGIGGRPVVVMAGRFHCYEGYSFGQASSYVRVLRLCGIENLLLTNAAGCLNADYEVGDLMAVSDHINLSAFSPCTGENDERFGPRFFGMENAYDRKLRENAVSCAAKAGITLRQGVYAYMSGPQYETPAEIRALRILGADAVGMSTVPEAIEAAHCGMRTLCISCLTNYGAGMAERALSEREVDETAGKSGEKFRRLMKLLITEVL